MHTKPMSESEGTFEKAEPTDVPCRKCQGSSVTCKPWDSSCGGYTDYKYTCGDCDHTWWIDGPDA